MTNVARVNSVSSRNSSSHIYILEPDRSTYRWPHIKHTTKHRPDKSGIKGSSDTHTQLQVNNPPGTVAVSETRATTRAHTSDCLRNAKHHDTTVRVRRPFDGRSTSTYCVGRVSAPGELHASPDSSRLCKNKCYSAYTQPRGLVSR